MIFVRLLRLPRRWRELKATTQVEMTPVVAELRRWQALAAERRELSCPHRFIWRWNRHPLTQAVRESRRRRRARLERAAR